MSKPSFAPDKPSLAQTGPDFLGEGRAGRAVGLGHNTNRPTSFGQTEQAGFARYQALLSRTYPMEHPQIIYKITPRDTWEQAQRLGTFTGAPIDIADGFIHFSTAPQVAETAAKHFAGQDDLLLVAIDTATLGKSLKYEVSRGGDLFPHLYTDLSMTAVRWVKPMPLGDDGHHRLPELESTGS